MSYLFSQGPWDSPWKKYHGKHTMCDVLVFLLSNFETKMKSSFGNLCRWHNLWDLLKCANLEGYGQSICPRTRESNWVLAPAVWSVSLVKWGVWLGFGSHRHTLVFQEILQSYSGFGGVHEPPKNTALGGVKGVQKLTLKVSGRLRMYKIYIYNICNICETRGLAPFLSK